MLENELSHRQERLVLVSVFDPDGKLIEGARVAVESRDVGDRARHDLKFDAVHGVYLASNVAPGRYVLRAQAEGYAPDELTVQVDPAGLQAVVILGAPGLPFLYRGDVKTPFQPHPDLVGVALDHRTAANAVERLSAVAKQYKLTPVER